MISFDFFLLGFSIAIKHWLADRILRFPFEAQGKYKSSGWLWPLTIHCSIHTIMMMMIIICYSGSARLMIVCSLIDFGSHMMIDWLKVMATRKKWFTARIRTLIDQGCHAVAYIGILILMAYDFGM